MEKELDKHGISAFSKASSLVLISDKEHLGKLKCSHFLLKHNLFLPIDKRSPKYHIENVVESIGLIMEKRKSIFDIASCDGVVLKQDWKILGDLCSDNTF